MITNADGRGLSGSALFRDALTTLASSSVVVLATLFAIGSLLSEVFYREFGLDGRATGQSTTDMVLQAAGSAIWLVVLASPMLTFAVVAYLLQLGSGAAPDDEFVRRRREKFDIHAAFASGVFLLVCYGLPIGAVFVFGDPGRLGDWGIPIAAIGIGVVSLGFSLLSSQPGSSVHSGKLVVVRRRGRKARAQATPSFASMTISDIIRTTPPFPFPTTRRGMAIFTIVSYGVVFLVGTGLGVWGTLKDAQSVKDGDSRVGAPWSLSPSTREVSVVGAAAEAGLPDNSCLIVIGRGAGGVLLWDATTERLWQVDLGLSLRSC